MRASLKVAQSTVSKYMRTAPEHKRQLDQHLLAYLTRLDACRNATFS